MASHDTDGFPPEELQALRDSVLVVSARQRLDELLLDTLIAPGLALKEGARVAAFVTSERFTAAQEALDRLASWTQEA